MQFNLLSSKKENNFFFLLCSLLVLLLILPVIEYLSGTNNWFLSHISFSGVLIIAVLSLNQDKRWRNIGFVLALGGLAFSGITAYSLLEFFLILALLCDFLFILLVIFIAMRQVLFSEQINLHNIAGAVCIYLLLGILWSLAYHAINIIIPGSFQGNIPVETQSQLNDFVYFSFVTLTTLGYGDILPVTATARSLAYLEAVVGQFYLAILVAGLVSIHITNTLKETK